MYTVYCSLIYDIFMVEEIILGTENKVFMTQIICDTFQNCVFIEGFYLWKKEINFEKKDWTL